MTNGPLSGATTAAVATMMLLGSSTIGVAQHQVSISVSEPRPLARAAMELERQLGLIVTYEDPPWQYAGDLQDLTASVRRDGDLSRKVLVPRTEALTFVQPLPSDVNLEARAAVVSAIVDAYHRSGGGARFRVVQTGRMFHIVPSMSRDEMGVLQPRGSLLDIPVTFAEGERTILSVVQEIARQVSEASGVRVDSGTMAVNVLINARTSIGAGKEDARAVLVRALGVTGRPLSWHILCGLDATPSCALNIHVVRPGP